MKDGNLYILPLLVLGLLYCKIPEDTTKAKILYELCNPLLNDKISWNNNESQFVFRTLFMVPTFYVQKWCGVEGPFKCKQDLEAIYEEK
jgi:hypothetical protein